MGAALTYARRYSLFALVGIAGEDGVEHLEAKLLKPATLLRMRYNICLQTSFFGSLTKGLS